MGPPLEWGCVQCMPQAAAQQLVSSSLTAAPGPWYVSWVMLNLATACLGQLRSSYLGQAFSRRTEPPLDIPALAAA
jgi:hypothetical protein